MDYHERQRVQITLHYHLILYVVYRIKPGRLQCDVSHDPWGREELIKI